MELIDRDSHNKLYQQLLDILKRKIESKEWVVDSQIPTEQELCTVFNVSRSTVRSAVIELVHLGYLKRYQGRGTFVSRNIVHEGLTMQMNFKEVLFEETVAFEPTMLIRTVMMPVDDLELILNIPADKHIIYIKKIYSFNMEPVLMQEFYVPYHICPYLLEDNVEDCSLHVLFESKYGIKITEVKNYIDLTYLKENEAMLLRSSEGSVAVLLTQQFYSGDTLIMYSRSVKKPDRLNLHVAFERKTG
jgi:DNA-binding GntR family transcriptional regulator